MDLSGFAFDSSGNGVSGVTVDATAVGDDSPTASTFTDDDGAWSFSALATNAYYITLTHGSDVRIIDPSVQVQMTTIYGYDGVSAPLADGSVTTAQLQDSSVTSAKINAGAVTSAKIAASAVTTTLINDLAITEAKVALNAITDNTMGNRTVDDTAVPSTDTAKLTPLLSNLANRVVAITGESGWKDDPADTISSLDSRVTTLEEYPALTSASARSGSGTFNTISTLASVSLAAGTWFVTGVATVAPVSTTPFDVTIGIYDASGALDTAISATPPSASHHVSIPVSTVVTLGSTDTVALKGTASNSTTYSANSCFIHAVRIA